MPMVLMMVGGVVLFGFGIHTALADRAEQHRFAAAASCPAEISTAEARRTDCVQRGPRRVSYISTIKDTTSIGLDDDARILHFDRAPSWVLRLGDGDSVTVLSWRGRDEAVYGANRNTVYGLDSPIVAEHNHLVAALLGVMFACYGGASVLAAARVGFDAGARLYRRHPRIYDVVVAELTIVAVAAMIGTIFVGRGYVTYGIVLPAIAIPVAPVATALILRARFRRDLLNPRRLLPAGPVPDLE